MAPRRAVTHLYNGRSEQTTKDMASQRDARRD